MKTRPTDEDVKALRDAFDEARARANTERTTEAREAAKVAWDELTSAAQAQGKPWGCGRNYASRAGSRQWQEREAMRQDSIRRARCR